MKLVIHNGSRVWGGNEKWAATVAAGLRDRGHEVVVSCRAGGVVAERLAEMGVRTSGVRPGGDLDLLAALRFSRWLARERPDAVLATSWNRTPTVAWAARRAGVPRLVVRLGIVRPLPRRGRHTRSYRRGVDAMIVNAREIREEWIRSAPWFPAEAIHVVHNGIRPPAAVPGEERAAVRAELGAPPGVPLIAGVGHVYPRKGFDLLIDAFAALPGREGRLAIVGSGPHEAELRERAERLGVADRVLWPGFRSDVPRVLAASDVFALSSRNEGMANVVLEAMAVGTPVVATDISGVRYALGAGAGEAPAGWIVPPEDPAALARALGEVLTDLRERPEAVAERVREARRRVEERFGVERMVSETERVLFGRSG